MALNVTLHEMAFSVLIRRRTKKRKEKCFFMHVLHPLGHVTHTFLFWGKIKKKPSDRIHCRQNINQRFNLKTGSTAFVYFNSRPSFNL